MKREEFLYICGNISKHNHLRLSSVAKKILRILKKSTPDIGLENAFSTINEFYEWFYDGVFHYHLSKISELLNNIDWGIQNYLLYEFYRSYTVDPEKSRQLGIEYYFFKYPQNVDSDLGKIYYWELMNEIRDKPYIKKFEASKYLQGRY